MEIALQILLALVAVICFLGGVNLLLKGVKAFLPPDYPSQVILDNLFRFLSGIYFGLGFLMTYVIFHINQLHDLTYFIALVVVFSGLGRLYSRIKVGTAGKYFDFIMLFEIILGISIAVLHYLR